MSGKPIDDAVRALAAGLVAAVMADEQGDGCDISAGLLGSATTSWLVAIAAAQQPGQEGGGERKGCGDPTCGCDWPSFTEPMEALRLLSGRMKYAGIAEGVARSYARDIDDILAKYDTAPPPSVPDGLAFVRQSDGSIVVTGESYGSAVVAADDAQMASALLYMLACDLLAAAPSAKEVAS